MGKTLIAAVVMRLHRWYPTGIMCSWRLPAIAAQQVGACHDVMGIPEYDTARMEGSVSTDKRRELWRNRRMIFYLRPSRMTCAPAIVLLDEWFAW